MAAGYCMIDTQRGVSVRQTHLYTHALLQHLRPDPLNLRWIEPRTIVGAVQTYGGVAKPLNPKVVTD